MNYTIHQLPVENGLTFMTLRFAQAHGGVKIPDYKTVYTGQIQDGDPNEILEKLFVQFNYNHPADYKARSLSVSDLVTLEGIGTYFCDSVGWKNIDW